jgi:hypothetical protein
MILLLLTTNEARKGSCDRKRACRGGLLAFKPIIDDKGKLIA